mgnify:FL=1
MRFSQQFIDEIKDRNPIEEVVSRYVPLKRAGSNLVGICPFHNEKSPSFTVFPATKSYYCFGCGAGGDIFGFVMQTEGLDYPSAVETLAERAGIPIEQDPAQEEYTRKPSVSRERVIEVTKAAGRFFYACLYSDIGENARAYLEKRKITPVTIKRFGIGYSPDGWSSLYDHLRSKGFSDEEMKTAFLIGISKNGRPFDMFRNRIMFPVFDINGDCVAFSGRRLNEHDERKYINTSDTPAFKKSKVLFGMNIAKQNNDGTLIMCEGAVDAIALQQAGFSNAVATLGTAITSEHARMISRFVKTVFLAYDIDKAGRNATDKAIRLLNEVGVSAKIIDLGNETKDPDEFIKKFGAEAFRRRLKGSSGQVDYAIDRIISQNNISTPDGKLQAASALYAYIGGIWDRTEREVYARRAAEKLDLPAKIVTEEVEIRFRRTERKQKTEKIKSELREAEGYGDKVNRDKIRFSSAAAMEERLLGILMNRPDIAKEIASEITPELFATGFDRKIYEMFRDDFVSGNEVTISKNGELSPDEAGAVARMIAKRAKLTGNTVNEARALIAALKQEEQKRLADAMIKADPINGLTDYINSLRQNKADRKE